MTPAYQAARQQAAFIERSSRGRLLVSELGDVILLSLPGDVKDTVLARLDQFIFSEDVQLGDVTATFGQVAVVGPDAARVVSVLIDVPVARLTSLPEHGNIR